MNRAVVLRTTWGLAHYIEETFGADGRKRGVVIGFDGRHMSREFAEDTACALAAAGIHAHLFVDVVPTPLLAFAVTRLKTAAGVMVRRATTAGVQRLQGVLSNGAQIVPPTDVGIAQAISGAPRAKDVPRLPLEEAKTKGSSSWSAKSSSMRTSPK